MIKKNKLYKMCLLSTSLISIGTIFTITNNSNNINNISAARLNDYSNRFATRIKDINSGTITTKDYESYVEVNLSGYDIDLNKYKVNVDQTSETGIPLQNDFQINFKIVSKNQFRIYRTTIRRYYRLYILDKNSQDDNDKQYFKRVIKVDDFSINNNGGNNNQKIESNIKIIDLNNVENKNKFNSYFIEKNFFVKEKGFNIELLNEMQKWSMDKVYDEFNNILFNSVSKTTFVNETKEIGFLVDSYNKNDNKIEILNFWIILKDNYIFQFNNANSLLISSEFLIEKNSPPTIDGNDTVTSNKNSSNKETTIFAVSISTGLLFLIFIILFIIISNKNKNKQKRNHDLEKAIKNRSKI